MLSKIYHFVKHLAKGYGVFLPKIFEPEIINYLFKDFVVCVKILFDIRISFQYGIPRLERKYKFNQYIWDTKWILYFSIYFHVNNKKIEVPWCNQIRWSVLQVDIHVYFTLLLSFIMFEIACLYSLWCLISCKNKWLNWSGWFFYFITIE